MTIQKFDWVSKDTKLNANGWSVPLIQIHLKIHIIFCISPFVLQKQRF